MHRFIQIILGLLARLPMPALHALSSTIYIAAYYIFRWRRTMVTEGLTTAFPNMSPSEVEKLAKQHFRGLFDTSLEAVKAHNLGAADIQSRVTIKNLDLLTSMAEKPFLLVSGHQGNWEWQMLALANALPLPIEAIYAPVRSAAVDDFLLQIRTKYGTTMIKPNETLVEIAKRLKVPRVVMLLADQNPRRDVERCWLRFLEQDTAFGVGLEKIARLTRYPIVFQHGYRVGRGHYEICYELLTEPPYDKTGHRVTEQFAAKLEASIQANPADWLWSYERWRYAKPMYG